MLSKTCYKPFKCNWAGRRGADSVDVAISQIGSIVVTTVDREPKTGGSRLRNWEIARCHYKSVHGNERHTDTEIFPQGLLTDDST